jgi:hypothetical protein
MSGEGTSASARYAVARRVDAVCDRFETAWKAVPPGGAPPRLEDYLDAEVESSALLRELITLDAHYRRARGDTPRPEDYSPWFGSVAPTWLADAVTLPLPAPTVPLDLASSGGAALSLTVVGRFRITHELGRGGFGIVFLAEDSRLGRKVALKVPRPEVAGEPTLRQRFLREAHSAAALDHPNVASVYEAGEADGLCYIASAYCPGGNLAAWLRRHPGPVPMRQAAALVAALAGAVQHAHEHGVLHRDLKPSNILLAPPSGEADELGFVPKVTDFGLAKLLEEADDETTSGILLGTPSYMAPEQVEGRSRAVGVATDVYALGVILYELLTGRTPFRGPSLLMTLDQVRTAEPVAPRALRRDVARDLDVICLKCLQKSPRDRYASAADLAADVQRFLRHEPIRARPVGFVTRAWRWCQRPERIRNARVVAALMGAVATANCLGGIGLVSIGAVPTDNLAAAIVFFLFLIVGLGIPDLWVGLVAAADDVRALWCGLLIPVIIGPIQALFCIEVLPAGGVSNIGADPGAWYAQTLTLLGLFSIQLVAFTLALNAHFANR